MLDDVFEKEIDNYLENEYCKNICFCKQVKECREILHIRCLSFNHKKESLSTFVESRAKEISALRAKESFVGDQNQKLCEQQQRIEVLEKENELVKSLLHCTKETCDNCGFVKCENFQRQRKSVPCNLYTSYQDRIKNLENESDVLRESYNNSEMKLGNAKEIIKDLLSLKSVVSSAEDVRKRFSVRERAEKFIG